MTTAPASTRNRLAVAVALALVLVLGAAPRSTLAEKRRLAHSFEGEAALSYGKRIFKYYRPARGQALDRSVLRGMLASREAHKFQQVNKKPPTATRRRQARLSNTHKARGITWNKLSDTGKATYLERLFRKETAHKLRPDFFSQYRADSFTMNKQQWDRLSPAKQREHVTYANLNQKGRKRFKEIMREVFPMRRTSKVPRAFEEVLFWESPTTYELRHKSKTGSARKVNAAVHWMKSAITDKVRPHRHVSWKPNLPAITTRRKEFLSFVQRVDLLMFSQRLEQGSKGALYGYYGKNFMPYSASLLRKIDQSMVKRTYSLFLGSKLHGLGLRTYKDGSVGLEIRPVSDARQLDWYANVVTRAIKKGAIGSIRYDREPVEFKAVGASLAGALSQRLKAAGVAAPSGRLAAWIDGQLQLAGLDHRLSYPLQRWERQPYVPQSKRGLITRQRQRFVGQVTTLLTRRAANKLDRHALRDGVAAAVWEFARQCQLSKHIDRSIQQPLAGKAVGPSLLAR